MSLQPRHLLLWGMLAICCAGLNGCRSPEMGESTSMRSVPNWDYHMKQARESHAAAEAEYRAAWEELQALRTMMDDSRARVETLNQQIEQRRKEMARVKKAIWKKSALLEAAHRRIEDTDAQ